jgi:hypothetical protein
MGQGRADANGVGALAAIDATKPHRFASGRTAKTATWASAVGVRPLAERKAEFFAAMKRIIQLGTLLPKAESLDPADAAGIAEAEIILAEIRKAQADLEAMMERERKLRDLQA